LTLYCFGKKGFGVVRGRRQGVNGGKVPHCIVCNGNTAEEGRKEA